MNDDVASILKGGATMERREERLAVAADEMASGRRSIFVHERFLLALAGILMSLGIALIGLAWVGASHSIHLEEQVPYLISGGVFGLALATIGSHCLLAHWHTVRLREARVADAARRKEHDELMERLLRVAEALESPEAAKNGRRQLVAERSPQRSAPGA